MNNRPRNKRMLYTVIAAAVVLTVALRSMGGVDAEGYADPEQLKNLIDNGNTAYLLADVRTPGEYSDGYIPTAVNMPLQGLGDSLPQVEKDALIIVYCRSGNRSSQAKKLLEEAGYTRVVDFGGISRWTYELAH